MICDSCKKLNVLISNKRKCVKCQSGLNDNLSVLCSNCSDREHVCAICIKSIKGVASTVKSVHCKSCTGK